MNKLTTELVRAALAIVFVTTAFGMAHAAKQEGEWYRNPTTGAIEQYRAQRRTGYASNKSPIRKTRVRFNSKYPVGTIVIDTSERRLYYVTSRGKAMKYGIGVGRDGFQWTGTHRITRKAEWPGWTPPKRMIARVKRETGKTLKGYYPGGPDNPLGARALYIGSTIYRIHGTNQPWSIGKAMSSGCIRLANDDVEDLYKRVGVGAKVVVRH